MTLRSEPSPAVAAAAFGSEVLAALDRLDQRLRTAIARADRIAAQHGPAAAFRGLYLDRSDVDRLLGDRLPPMPAGTAPQSDRLAGPARRNGGAGAPLEPLVPLPTPAPWQTLAEDCGLSSFDLDVVLIALAPELDLRYELLYAYVQDDITRRRPTVDLALELLCPTWESRLHRRVHFAADAPLLAARVLHLTAERDHFDPPLLARGLRLDDQVVRLLLGQDGADPRLTHCCRIVPPAPPADLGDIRAGALRTLAALLDDADPAGTPLRVQLCGPRGAGRRQVAEWVAQRLGARLAVVDLERMLAGQPAFAEALPLALREASWRGAVAYLTGIDALQGADRLVLSEALDGCSTVVLLAGRSPWQPVDDRRDRTIVVRLDELDVRQAAAWWRRSLAHLDAVVDAAAVEAVAGRFRLTPGQIERAAGAAMRAARWSALANAPPDGERVAPTAADLLAAAREGSAPALADLATKIIPRHGWDDLVLPDDARTQLREIAQRLSYRTRVLDDWGFAERLPNATGTTALFTGPSGTGKTMAVEVLAGDLGLDLYAVDLSGVVSKYIGETEENLARVFAAAERSGAVLFFDEAEALFGKRSEVRDAHDRYANIETAYLLQRMERYQGLAVLATNLRGNLDPSFLRRLDFSVAFPFPDAPARERIWAGIWPRGVPLADDVDLHVMARDYALTGGNIRNVALAAAFLAAAEEQPVARRHLLRALRREYQKLGMPFDDTQDSPGRGSGAP